MIPGTGSYEYWTCPNCGVRVPLGMTHFCGQPSYYVPCSGWYNSSTYAYIDPTTLERIAKALEEIAHPDEKEISDRKKRAWRAATEMFEYLESCKGFTKIVKGMDEDEAEDMIKALSKIIQTAQ